MQKFAFLFVELQKAPVSPVLQPVEAPPDHSTTLCCIIHSSQICFIHRLAAGSHCPILHITDEDVTQHWSQYQSLWCTTSAWPPWAWLFSQVSYLTSACFQWRFLEAGSYTLHRHLYSWGFFCLQCMHLQNLSLTTESKQCTTTWLCQDVSL